jgi:endonuclease/exonuclease/phosphatase family metal-dependent hydrolase
MRFLAYNTHLFMDTVLELGSNTTFEDATRKSDIIARLSTSGADVIGLSEVWANDSKQSFINGLKSIYPYALWDNNTNLFQVGSGLLMLSKYPLLNGAFTRFTNLAIPDSFSQKGFLTAQVKVGAVTVFLVHTHTQADSSQTAIDARASNIKQIVQKVQSLYQPGPSSPLVIMGDLNIVAEDGAGNRTAEYQFLLGQFAPLGVSDLFRTLNPSAPSAPGYTYDAVHNGLIAIFAPEDATNRVQQRLDYLFTGQVAPASFALLNGAFMYQSSKGAMDLSDHYPIQGDVTLPGA